MTMLLDIGAGRVATVATFYKVSQLLGVGRFSEVYKAFDTHSDTDVALKIYSGFDEEAHEIAKTEESALARISELNSEYFPKLRRSIRHRIQNRNHPVIVMELGGYIGLDGHKRVLSLNDVVLRPGIASGSLEPDLEFWSIESLIVWIIHLVQAVKQLHDLGILHRDLKPANILLKRGTGQSSAVPMLLDFNSAAPLRASGSTRGTPRYLPPEVISGTRSEPAPADDIWAVALIAWEILHGQGTSPDSPCIASGSIVGSIPDSVIETLRRALSLDPGARFATAVDLLDALESAVRPAETLNVLASDEVARARSAMDRIKNVMLQAVAPPGELLVPKEIEDTVTTVIAWLAEENSQSLDLVSELVRIGPLAIPVCLEQGYRLHRNKLTYSEVLRAIAQLASQHKSVAHTSIDKHALSSNQGVRSLCFALCEEIGYFPEVMLDSLKGDEGVLLPAERLLIADLCVRFSRRRTAVFGLEKYMCREYILNRHRFRILRDTVARKMHLLQSGEQKFITPLLICEDTRRCVWRELKEFEDLPESQAIEIEKGLLELMAEAFAASGLAALEILKSGKVARSAGPMNLPVFRRFAAKLAEANPEARAWLEMEVLRHPTDPDLRLAMRKSTEEDGVHVTAAQLAIDYLGSGNRKLFNILRFWNTPEVLAFLEVHLSRTVDDTEVGRALEILKGYETRMRGPVVKVVLANWSRLSAYDFGTTVQVLTAYDVPESSRSRVVDFLNAELAGPNESVARKGLERLLR